MNAIDFVIRTGAGAVERGSVGGEGQGFLLDAGHGNDISLNISQADLRGYDRAANDLLITLADGRVIVLENYFTGEGAGDANSRLFLSANGDLNQVSFVEADGGALFAQYGPTESWGKWSPSDQLIFVDDPEVTQFADGYDGEEEDVGMLAALPLLGMGGAGAGGLGALLGLPLLFGRNGGGDDSETTTTETPTTETPVSQTPVDVTPWIAPTVNSADSSTNISGNDPAKVVVSGTANPGSTVTVVIGGETVTGTAGPDRNWEVVFENNQFPPDGTYPDVSVTVTDPNGTVSNPDGPSFVIDTTPPALAVTDGTVSVHEIVNGVEHASGVTVAGTGEAGATLTVTIGTQTFNGVVAADGTWSFTTDSTVFPAGEYTTAITVTAKDSFGNATTIADSVQIDTVNTISLDNAPLTGDDLISAAERTAGVTLTGTSQAGSTVVVTIGGVSQTVTAGTNGSWSTTFTASQLQAGTYTTSATITSTDAAGNVSTMSHTFKVDTEQSVMINTAAIAGDGVINAAEYAGAVTVTGTGEPGATVTVTSGTNTLGTATVGANGTWSMQVQPSMIDGGPGHSELGYTGTLTVTSVDAAGNSATASGTVKVDTNVSILAFVQDADGTINAAERNAGVLVQGTSEPGATITLTIGTSVLTATAGSTGAWTMTIPTGLIPTGTTTLNGTFKATDLAGNSTTQAFSMPVDTTTTVTMNTATVEGDGTVNAVERADGVVLTGTNEAGATVVVTVNGTDYTATVTGTTWSVNLPASAIPTGDTQLAVQAKSTDAHGNTATVNGSIDIDTITSVTVNTAGVEGDGIINKAEHADGVTLTGTAEPGATVTVTLGNITHPATVDANGSWTVFYSASEIPTGERTLTVTARATDVAGNVETASGTVAVDTLVRNFAITSTPGGADGIVNAAERTAGITLTGTTEPGGTVALTMNGHTVNAVVAANGTWTAFFSASQIPTGDNIQTTLTARSTDPAGNTETLTKTINIDTDAGLLTIDSTPIEGDDVVNFVEASDGVIITGTSNPGQWVVVTMGGVSHTVQTGANGKWTAPFAANEITQGTYDATITAQITDSAGNQLTRTDSVHFDTVVDNFATQTNPIAGDNIINASERATSGFVLSGTTEPGASVSVSYNGYTHSATVQPNGNWTVTFPTAEVPTGERPAVATVNTTDVAGNTASTTVNFAIDTLVNNLTLARPIAGDNVVNAAEQMAGITLTGTVEPGSTVSVRLNGFDHLATVSSTGAWTVDIPSNHIPTGTRDVSLVVNATDAAGNTASVSEMVHIDTDAPDTLTWTGYGRGGTGIAQIWTDNLETGADLYLGKIVNPNGAASVSEVQISNDVTAGQTTFHFLQTSVTDGTHLVLASTDAAGNTSGAYLVTDDIHTNTVQMSDSIANALRAFNVDTIDLQWAEDSQLTITESQIKALSATSDTVAIHGGSDDTVTITGARAAGTHSENGHDYNVFTLGGATLYIDQDITHVNGVV